MKIPQHRTIVDTEIQLWRLRISFVQLWNSATIQKNPKSQNTTKKLKRSKIHWNQHPMIIRYMPMSKIFCTNTSVVLYNQKDLTRQRVTKLSVGKQRKKAVNECRYRTQANYCPLPLSAWWRRQIETFSALLAICAGNSQVPGEFPTQKPVTWSFDIFYDLRLNKRLSKQSWGRWFETLSCPLWRHCNGIFTIIILGEWLREYMAVAQSNYILKSILYVIYQWAFKLYTKVHIVRHIPMSM